VVDDLVTGLAQVLLEVRAELETGVIGGDVDAHAHSLGKAADAAAAPAARPH
jgi:hypothetical protein